MKTLLKLRFNSIRSRIILYFLLFSIPVFLVFAYLGEHYTKKAIYEKTIDQAQTKVILANSAIDRLNMEISQKANRIAKTVEKNSLDKAKKLIKSDLRQTDSIYGMAIAFLPKYAPNRSYFCIYYHKTPKGIVKKNLVPPNYYYTKFDWFKKPIKERKNLWSNPYFDKNGGEIWMSTYSSLIKNRDGKIIGVATADVSLEYLSDIVSNIKILKSGRAFIASNSGDVLAPALSYNDYNTDLSSLLRNFKSSVFPSIKSKILNKQSGHKRVWLNNREFFILFIPIGDTNLNMNFVFDFDELFSPITHLRIYYTVLSFLAVVLFVAIIVFMTKGVTRDLTKIENISNNISKGNFDVPIPEGLSYEAKSVADALKKMQASLKEYIKKVEKTAKLENELEYANKIQQTFVPNKFTKTVNGIEFVASSAWAKQVGGDFYGVVELSNNRVLFYIGDVSGKGIPAALYVAIIKSMLDNISPTIGSLSRILNILNNYLSSISKNFTFTTMFIGIIDNNKLSFCNAGHIPPIILHKNGCFSQFVSTKDMPLGAFGNLNFKEKIFSIKNIHGIFAYSDGLTDTFSKDNMRFDFEKLKNILLKLTSEKPELIIKKIIEAQQSFADTKELYDDTTIILLKFTHNNPQ